MLTVPHEVAITFDLKYPQTVKGKTYDLLEARRPKVKDLRTLAMGSEKDPIGAYSNFLAQLCMVPPDVINELELVDYDVIKEWVKDFLPKSEEQTS